MTTVGATDPAGAPAGGERLFRALCVLVALAPWVILPGNDPPAQRPQAAFIQVGALVLLVTVLAGAVRHRRLAVLATPFDAPLVALLAWSGLSLSWSLSRHDGLVVWMHGAACAAVFWLSAAALRDESDARRVLLALFVPGVLLSLLGLLQHAFGLTLLPQAEPPAATFVHKNVAAAFVVMTAPLGPTLLLHRPRSKLLIQYVAGTSLMVSFIVVTFTRSAWLALGAQSVLFTLLLLRDRDLRVRWPAPKRVMARALAIAVLVASGTTYAVLGPDGMAAAWDRVTEVWRVFEAPPASSRPGSESRHASVEHWRAVWLDTLALARDAPLTGVGLGNYRAVYPAYARSAATARAEADFAHNDYLQVFAELGLVGIALFAWAAVMLWRALRRLWLREVAERRALVLGAGLGLAGMAVDAAFSFPLYQALPPLVCAVYLGVLAALVTRFGWDAHAWRLFDAAKGARRLVPPLVAAAGCALFALVARQHARWLEADRHVWRMTQAEQRGDRPTALAQAEAAHRLDPHRPRTLRVIGEAHLAAGRSEEALAPLRALLEIRPYDFAAHKALGMLLVNVPGRRAEGEQHLRRVLELNPTDPDAAHIREMLARNE